MVGWILETAQSLRPDHIVVVTAPHAEMVKDYVSPHQKATQARQLGTGDAVKAARDALKDFRGTILVLYGDGPLYTQETLSQFLTAYHADHKASLGFLGMHPDNPYGYGRMIVDDQGSLSAIVEEKDADVDQRAIGFCWTGVMCGDAQKVFTWLDRIDNNNAKGEYYLTDLPKIAAQEGTPTMTGTAPVDETLGANTRAELSVLEDKVQNRLRQKVMEGGATLIDPKTVYLSHDTKIGKDVVIEPNVFFGPGVTIADNVTIHAFSHLEGVTVGQGAQIGPFARLRPKSTIEDGAVIGNFIEVNRSTVKAGAKAKHMSYLGDAVIGPKSNIGAGTVIANYDGFNKQDTILGDGVFIGSNSTIIAPCTIEDGAIIGGGSVVTQDVPKDALYLERGKPDIRQGGATAYRDKKKKV